jgi:hypothetical protein
VAQPKKRITQKIDLRLSLSTPDFASAQKSGCRFPPHVARELKILAIF